MEDKQMKGLPRNFKALILATLPYQLVSSISGILFLWIVLEYTASPILGGIFSDVSEIGILFIVPISLYISRVKGKKSVYIKSQLFVALSAIVVFIIFLTGNRMWELIAIFSLSFTNMFLLLFARTIVVFWQSQFLQKEQYQGGFAYSEALIAAANLGSYALAGILTYFNYSYALGIFAVGILFSTILATRIHPESDNYVPPERKPFRESYSEITKNPSMKQYLAYVFTSGFITAPMSLILLELVIIRFSGSSFALTFILTVSMSATIIGPMLASKVKKGILTNFIIISIAPIALLMILLAFLFQYIFVAIDLFFILLAFTFHLPFSGNLKYSIADEKHIIALQSIDDLLQFLPYLIMLPITGIVIQLFGIDYALYLAAVMPIIAIAVLYKSEELHHFSVQGE